MQTVQPKPPKQQVSLFEATWRIRLARVLVWAQRRLAAIGTKLNGWVDRLLAIEVRQD